MRFLGVFTALLTLASALPSPIDTEEVEDFSLDTRKLHHRKHPKCSPVGHVIVVSEFGQPRHGLGTMTNIVQAIQQYFPGTTNYSVPYNKKNTNPDKVQLAKVGARNVREYTRWYSDGCPDVPLIFLAYSEGALIATNGICGRSHVGDPDQPPLADKYGQRTIATVVWGDPTFVSRQSWDKGTCYSGYGVNPRQTPSNCHAFSGNMQSYCVVGDPVCCRGNDQNQHYVYNSQYGQDTFQFVYSKYKAWQDNHRK